MLKSIRSLFVKAVVEDTLEEWEYAHAAAVRETERRQAQARAERAAQAGSREWERLMGIAAAQDEAARMARGRR